MSTLERFQNYIAGMFVDSAERAALMHKSADLITANAEVKSVWVEFAGATHDPFTLG